MAKTTKTTEASTTTATRGRGRPPAGEGRDSATIALENLQAALDRTCASINDHPNVSVAARVARCARAGVPQAKARAALGALESALSDAQAAMERAYAAPAERATVAQRVNLLD